MWGLSVIVAGGIAGLSAGAWAQEGVGGVAAAEGQGVAAAEVRAIVDAMKRDAAARPVTWEDAIEIAGDFQFRYHANFDADDAGGGGARDGDFQSGFGFARMRLEVLAKVPGTDLSFRCMGRFRSNEGDFRLDDAYVNWQSSDRWAVRVGQFRMPFTREYGGGSSTKSMFAERSLADAIFRTDRSVGVRVTHTRERVRLFGAMHNGRDTRSLDYTDPDVADVALAARAELRLGDAPWGAYKDLNAFPGSDFGAMLGAAVFWQQDGLTLAPAGFGDNANYLGVTADVSVEGDGWNLLLVGFSHFISGGGEAIDEFGVTAHAGYFVSERVELMARYSHIFPDPERGGNDADFPAYSVGFNYYFTPGSHNAKITTELAYYPRAQSDSAALVGASSGDGLLRDADDEQWSLIVQFQYLF